MIFVVGQKGETMDDYIKREDAYNTLTDYYHHRTDLQHDALRDALSRVPTADVRENVRGEWLHISDGYCDFLKCSQCGKTTDNQSNFCPNCGCLMKGEDE